MCLLCGEVVYYIDRYDKGGVEMWKAFVNFKLAWIMDKGKQSLSVAIAAPLRHCGPPFGGQDGDKLSLPYAKTEDSEWRRSRWVSEEEIMAIHFKGDLGSISHVERSTRMLDMNNEHFHRHVRRNSSMGQSYLRVQPFQWCVAMCSPKIWQTTNILPQLPKKCFVWKFFLS